MTRMEQARAAGDRTVVWIAPRAAHARDAAVHYAAGARDWATPRLEHGFAAARQQAGATTRERILPALAAGRARMTAYGRDTVAPAVAPRAQSAMDTAKHRVQDDLVPRAQTAAVAAREAGEPMLHEARSRAEAALMALRGDVTQAEMNKIVKKKRHRKRNSLLVLLVGIGIGATAGWFWWQRKAAEPEWKADENMTMPATTGAGPDAYRSGSTAVTDPGHVSEDDEETKDDEGMPTAATKGKHRNKS